MLFRSLHGLNANQVFLGNGSDEVLAHVFAGLLKQSKPVHFPDITYSFYPVYCKLFGIDYKTIPLSKDFEINLNDYMTPNGGVIFPNPNAPTGRSIPRSKIETLLTKNKESVLVIDEAYVDFGAASCLPFINELDNLMVVQTLSKSRALAGLRVGFAFASPDLIEALERVKNSFNSYTVDRVAMAGAIAAIEDEAWFEANRAQVMKSRKTLSDALQNIGFEVLDSKANFLFVRHRSHDAAKLAQGLRQKNILVRHFAKAGIDQFLRISIGDEDQCQALILALQKIGRAHV